MADEAEVMDATRTDELGDGLPVELGEERLDDCALPVAGSAAEFLPIAFEIGLRESRDAIPVVRGRGR